MCPAQRAVLVTGASSGIGRKVVERLSAQNYFVYAGARRDADIAALVSLPNVQPLRLDVTKKDDIDAGAEQVTSGGRGLYGIVNNAGVGSLGPVLGGDEEEFDLIMKVNVYGPYKVTKAFANLVAACRGRIVMIGSISGTVAGKHASAYSMSKHAMEAFTDSLALEMDRYGVQVSIIEPGIFKTEIGRNAIARLGVNSGLPDYARLCEPDEVADAVLRAIGDEHPKRRYLVAANQNEARQVIESQVCRLLQLNERHRYSYKSDDLVRLIEQSGIELAGRER